MLLTVIDESFHWAQCAFSCVNDFGETGTHLNRFSLGGDVLSNNLEMCVLILVIVVICHSMMLVYLGLLVSVKLIIII